MPVYGFDYRPVTAAAQGAPSCCSTCGSTQLIPLGTPYTRNDALKLFVVVAHRCLECSAQSPEAVVGTPSMSGDLAISDDATPRARRGLRLAGAHPPITRGLSRGARARRATLARSAAGAGARLREQLAVFAAWLKATVVPKPTLFPRRGGLLVLQHYEDLFGGNSAELRRFAAQFDGVADNILWLPEGITATYFDRRGASIGLAKRRGAVSPSDAIYGPAPNPASDARSGARPRRHPTRRSRT